MNSFIRAIEYHLPDRHLDNVELASLFEGWSATKIEFKTGIKSRRVAGENETASDLGVTAAGKLFDSGVIRRDEVDFLLFCSESPDYPLPPTACVVQNRLGIPVNCGALDFNLGCSGFVYGLGLAHALIMSDQARNVLLITADTYTKYIAPTDQTTRTIFGDGAAATLISQCPEPRIGPFVYGTDGSGCNNLIVERGGSRSKLSAVFEKSPQPDHLHMNGPEVFNFSITEVPKAVQALLNKAGISLDAVNCTVFHQANKFMLEHLRDKIGIDANRFFIEMTETGNTVSASIPIALKIAADRGVITSGMTIMLVGFGVGYSWAATLLRWK